MLPSEVKKILTWQLKGGEKLQHLCPVLENNGKPDKNGPRDYGFPKLASGKYLHKTQIIIKAKMPPPGFEPGTVL